MTEAGTDTRWSDTPQGFIEALAGVARGADTSSVFLTPEWLGAWLDVYRPADPRVLTVSRDGHPMAALPLALRTSAGVIRTLEFAGSGSLTPNHLDLIAGAADRGVALRTVVDELASSAGWWDMLELDKLDGRSETARVLAEELAGRGFGVTLEDSAQCPCSALPATYDEYLHRLSKTTRGHIGQRLRKLQREHEGVRFEQAVTVEQVDAALDALIALHQTRWQQRGHPGVFADARAVRFHRAASRAALAAGTLRLRTLFADGAPIAVDYGYRVGDTVQAYQTGFDASWSQYSPGMLLGAHCIEQSILEGARLFDYLEGQESYKSSWCDHQVTDVRLRVFGRTPRGRLAALRCRSERAAIDTARRWLPEDVRADARRRMDRVRASLRRPSAH